MIWLIALNLTATLAAVYLIWRRNNMNVLESIGLLKNLAKGAADDLSKLNDDIPSRVAAIKAAGGDDEAVFAELAGVKDEVQRFMALTASIDTQLADAAKPAVPPSADGGGIGDPPPDPNG